jgi:hypothetical protein
VFESTSNFSGGRQGEDFVDQKKTAAEHGPIFEVAKASVVFCVKFAMTAPQGFLKYASKQVKTSHH